MEYYNTFCTCSGGGTSDVDLIRCKISHPSFKAVNVYPVTELSAFHKMWTTLE